MLLMLTMLRKEKQKMRVEKLTDTITITDAIVILVLTGYTVAWSGFVLSMCWAWFVVPTFGVREISIPVALGLTLIVRVVVGGKSTKDKTTKDENENTSLADAFAKLLAATAKYAVILFAAWLIKDWM